MSHNHGKNSGWTKYDGVRTGSGYWQEGMKADCVACFARGDCVHHVGHKIQSHQTVNYIFSKSWLFFFGTFWKELQFTKNSNVFDVMIISYSFFFFFNLFEKVSYAFFKVYCISIYLFTIYSFKHFNACAAIGLPSQGLRKYHNEKHWLYTKKNTPRGVLLTSCQKQLLVTWKDGANYYFDIWFWHFGSHFWLVNVAADNQWLSA